MAAWPGAEPKPNLEGRPTTESSPARGGAERRCGRRWLLAAAGLAFLSASPVAAASLIGTSTTIYPFESATRFYLHYANGHYWVAFHNGTEPVLYSSPDGAAWTLRGPIFSSFDPPPDLGRWAVRYQNANIIALAYEGGLQTRYYRNAVLNSNGFVSWDQLDAVAGPTGISSWDALNALIVNGRPIMWRADGQGEGEFRLGSQLNSPTWTPTTGDAPVITTTTDGSFSAGAVFPTGGPDPNDLIALRATSNGIHIADRHRLIAIKYDASADPDPYEAAWYNVSTLNGGLTEGDDTKVKEATPQVRRQMFAAVQDTQGNIHAVYVNRLNDVVHYRKAVGFNDFWSRPFGATDITGSGAAIDRVALASAPNNNLFLFYSKSDGGIYYRRYDGAAWGATETTVKAASATPLQGALAVMEHAFGCPIGVAWAEGSVSPYSVMFSLIPGACLELTTSASGTTITVESAEAKMVWDSAANAGGGLNEFYGKTEANPTVNRSGDTTAYNVFSTQINDEDPDPNTWHFEGYDNGIGGKPGAVTPLEVTRTRVKLRQSYQYSTTASIVRDWSVYAYPRLAINEVLSFTTNDWRRGAQGIHAKGEDTCGGGNTFFCASKSDETNAIWIASDDAGTYSDMLVIADTAPFFGRGGTNYNWEFGPPAEGGTPNTMYARVHEPDQIQDPAPGSYPRFYLFYPYLAGITSTGTQWQAYANDYWGAATLTINGGKGSPWNHSSENSGGDDFNDAENAYVVQYSPGVGLDFNIDGSGTNRKKPFFKIRQWRSLQDPATVTMGTTTLVNDVDYKADVKPVSRAYFCTTSGCGTFTQIANGGLFGAGESLADSASNFLLNFTSTSEYLYVGADSQFRGLNVILATAGTGGATLQWEYWNGAWTALTGSFGFTDQTNDLKKNGTIYWTSDPTGWTTRAVAGSPNLYYVRAHVSGGSYTQKPIENQIRTDILLFQYCSDVTTNAQFVFGLPVATAVELMSFDATGVDGAVELSWRTGSELDNLGFQLYRSASAEGPYERITASVIPGLGSSPVGASYSYRDAGLANGVTYFYRLEDIETTGATKLHGPVQATPRAGSVAGEPPPGEEGGPGGGSGGEPGSSGGAGGRIAYGDPSLNTLRVTREGTGAVVELVTEGFYAVPQGDGTARLEVPGFEESGTPGAPAVPSRRAWLEAAAGRGVELTSVRALEVTSYSDLRLAATRTPALEVGPEGTVKAGHRRRGGGEALRRAGLFPPEAARVAGTAFQGDVKKAELELSPLRWDGASQQLLVARRLVVRISFGGREGKERSLGGSRGRRYQPQLSAVQGPVVAQVVVKERGIYGVRFEEVLGARRRVSTGNLRLSRQGEAVAFHVEPETGYFGPGSVLYFVSEGASLNPYGAEAVYEVEVGPQGTLMGTATSATSGPAVGYYRHRGEWEENRTYQAGLLDAPDQWQWEAVLSRTTRIYPFTVSALSGGTARLEVWLQGGSDFAADPDHHVRLSLNGSEVADVSWDGMEAKKVEADVPAGALLEGRNELQVENAGDTAAAYSVIYLDKFGLTCLRRLVAEGGVLQGTFEQSGVAEIGSLGKGAVVVEWAGGEPRWLRGAVRGMGGLSMGVEAGRSYLAAVPLRPEVRRPVASTLRNEANRADYLLIAPRELLDAAQPLLTRRASQGLAVKGVAIEEVYQEFGHGESRPEAVKEFIAYAYHRWQAPSVRYVLLLGDATYDFKDHLGTGQVNQVPPLMVRTGYLWTSSDPGYAAVNGEDVLPDLAIGRLSARDAEEAGRLVQKVLAFEDSGLGFGGRAVLVADDADAAGDFEGDAEGIAALLGGREVERVYLGDLGGATRGAILDAFDRGASLMSYVGHGAVAVWASENVFNVMDVQGLAPQPRQPLLMTMNCLNGYIQMPGLNSLAEELVKAEGKGALGAFAPSGLSLDGPAHVYQKALVSELASGRHERLGDAMLAAQTVYADSGGPPELLTIYHLLADPGLELR